MLIRLLRLICEANPDFISSLAGDPDADSDRADDSALGNDGAGEAGAGTNGDAGSNSRSNQAGSARTPGTAQGQSQGQPADNAGRDQLSNLNAALRETRGENKHLKDTLAQLQQRLEKLEKPPAEPEKEPDFLEDPAGVVNKLAKRLDESEKQRKEREEAEASQREQQQQAQKTWNKVISSETEFAAKTPDYHHALAHVRGILTEQVRLANPEATDEQIAQHIQIQEAQGAVHILRQGRNPSEVYYQYAQKLGYKPQAAPAAAVNGSVRPDKDAVRTMGSGGGDAVREEPEGRKGALSELAEAHAELKEERKKNARSR